MSIALKEQQFNSFDEFITDRTMIQFGATFIIALQIKQISTNMSESILNPIIEKILQSDINKFKVNVFGINFVLGRVITSVITFFLTMLMIYGAVKLTKIYTKFDDDKSNALEEKTVQEKTHLKK